VYFQDKGGCNVVLEPKHHDVWRFYLSSWGRTVTSSIYLLWKLHRVSIAGLRIDVDVGVMRNEPPVRHIAPPIQTTSFYHVTNILPKCLYFQVMWPRTLVNSTCSVCKWV